MQCRAVLNVVLCRVTRLVPRSTGEFVLNPTVGRLSDTFVPCVLVVPALQCLPRRLPGAVCATPAPSSPQDALPCTVADAGAACASVARCFRYGRKPFMLIAPIVALVLKSLVAVRPSLLTLSLEKVRCDEPSRVDTPSPIGGPSASCGCLNGGVVGVLSKPDTVRLFGGTRECDPNIHQFPPLPLPLPPPPPPLLLLLQRSHSRLVVACPGALRRAAHDVRHDNVLGRPRRSELGAGARDQLWEALLVRAPFSNPALPRPALHRPVSCRFG